MMFVLRGIHARRTTHAANTFVFSLKVELSLKVEFSLKIELYLKIEFDYRRKAGCFCSSPAQRVTYPTPSLTYIAASLN